MFVSSPLYRCWKEHVSWIGPGSAASMPVYPEGLGITAAKLMPNVQRAMYCLYQNLILIQQFQDIEYMSMSQEVHKNLLYYETRPTNKP